MPDVRSLIDSDEALKSLGYNTMKRPDKEKVKDKSKNASAKSLRFAGGVSRACCNPLCRSDFSPKRKDQRFCGPKCKKTYFTLKYAIQILVPYFTVDTASRETNESYRRNDETF